MAARTVGMTGTVHSGPASVYALQYALRVTSVASLEIPHALKSALHWVRVGGFTAAGTLHLRSAARVRRSRRRYELVAAAAPRPPAATHAPEAGSPDAGPAWT